MSQNLAEKVRICTIFAGTITGNGTTASGSSAGIRKGLLLIDIISKANNDNLVDFQLFCTPTGGVEVSCSSVIHLTTAGVAPIRYAPIVITGICPDGALYGKTTAIGGTGPSIVARITLIGFLMRVMPTVQQYVTAWDAAV